MSETPTPAVTPADAGLAPPMPKHHLLTDRCRRAVTAAGLRAHRDRRKVTEIDTGDLLWGLLQDRSSLAYFVLDELGVTADAVADALRATQRGVPPEEGFSLAAGTCDAAGRQRFSAAVEDFLVRASGVAEGMGSRAVGSEHLLVALASEAGCTAALVLDQLGVRPSDVRVRTHNLSRNLVPAPGEYTGMVAPALAAARAAFQFAMLVLRRSGKVAPGAVTPGAGSGDRADAANAAAIDYLEHLDRKVKMFEDHLLAGEICALADGDAEFSARLRASMPPAGDAAPPYVASLRAACALFLGAGGPAAVACPAGVVNAGTIEPAQAALAALDEKLRTAAAAERHSPVRPQTAVGVADEGVSG